MQLSAFQTENRKLREQYSNEIVAHNSDMQHLEEAERKVNDLQDQLNKAKVRQFQEPLTACREVPSQGCIFNCTLQIVGPALQLWVG